MAILQVGTQRYNTIMVTNYPLANLQEFIDYWDTWHNEWQTIFSTNPISVPKHIFDWQVPKFIGASSGIESYMYFPEPYWGNVNANNVKRIFINLNPGQGNINQHINSLANGLSLNQYSNIVSPLASNPTYITTQKFFIPKRIEWVNKHINPTNPLQLDEYLGVDLIPWHTKTFGSVESAYAQSHKVLIINKVLSPILNLTSYIDIIGQGNKIKTILSMHLSNSIILGNIEVFPNPNVSMNNKVVVFKGTQGMYLPTHQNWPSGLIIN